MEDILMRSKVSKKDHAILVMEMRTLYEQMGDHVFLEKLTPLIRILWSYNERTQEIDRILDFVSKFVVEVGHAVREADETRMDEDEEKQTELSPLFLGLVRFLLESHEASNQHVRFRVCQLIDKLLSTLGNGASIGGDLFEQISKCILPRLTDISTEVRLAAIGALDRLQERKDPNCPVIAAFLFHMGSDPSVDVRKAVLYSIKITRDTIPGLVARTRDTSEQIRIWAFKIISVRVRVLSIPFALRGQLLRDGLRDRSEAVRLVMSEVFLPNWAQQMGGHLRLLSVLDVETNTEIIELALKQLFRKESYRTLVTKMESILNDKHLIRDDDNLNPESVIYWKCMVNYFKEEGSEEAMDAILPDITAYCDFLTRLHQDGPICLISAADPDLDESKRVYSITTKTFIWKNLLQIPINFDLQDEFGRPNLDKFVGRLLLSSSVGAELVEPLYCLIEKLFPKEQERLEQIDGIIKEICESSVANEDVSDEVDGLKKCLCLLVCVLKHSDIKTLDPILEPLCNNLVVPSISHEDSSVRNFAIRNLALCCLRSETLAKRYIASFVKVAETDTGELQRSAVCGICDILMMFGLSAFESTDENDPLPGLSGLSLDNNDTSVAKDEPKSPIFQMLVQLLDSENVDLRGVVATSLCRLLFLGRIFSPSLLSRLLILWFNPRTESDARLCQTLGVSLPAYASRGSKEQEAFVLAFIPTLQVISMAPRKSPLAEIEKENVVKFMLQLTGEKASKLSKNGNDMKELHVVGSQTHLNLGIRVGKAILADPDSTLVTPLVRVLTQLQLPNTSKADHDSLSKLLYLGQDMLKVLNKMQVKIMIKFCDTLREMIPKEYEEGDGDKTAEMDTSNFTIPPSPSNTSTPYKKGHGGRGKKRK